ncbi:MgtC/SapB family protein [Dankookia sp. P2]|uniref:MgtC/SapB family protein n=1 Tax=Dankookia sp. P2 TaxID=3423955 RepID=UPI003D677F0C
METSVIAWLATLGQGGTTAVLVVAFAIGAAVGVERGFSTSSVGIRTCTLVALASAAFADLVVRRVPDVQWGNAFGAVATGVGFLGAGAIIKGQGRRAARGLGEAGTIWCVAIIGLLVGTRESAPAFLVTALVLAVNLLLRPVAAWIDRHRAQQKPEDDVLDG